MNGIEQKWRNKMSLTHSGIAISEHERKQVIGHSKSDTFDHNYPSQHLRRDVQKLYQSQTEHLMV